MYADPSRSSASSRTNAFVSAGTFERDVEHLARRLRLSVPGLTDGEVHHLKDVADQRYRFVSLQRLMAIAARSTRPDDREALAEFVRRECLLGIDVIRDRAIVGRLEVVAQGPHDVAWNEYTLNPSRENAQRATGTGRAHIHGLRAQLDHLEVMSA